MKFNKFYRLATIVTILGGTAAPALAMRRSHVPDEKGAGVKAPVDPKSSTHWKSLCEQVVKEAVTFPRGEWQELHQGDVVVCDSDVITANGVKDSNWEEAGNPKKRGEVLIASEGDKAMCEFTEGTLANGCAMDFVLQEFETGCAEGDEVGCRTVGVHVSDGKTVTHYVVGPMEDSADSSEGEETGLPVN